MQIKVHKGSVDLSGTPILTEINIEINTNSRIAIVGRNGCGKTTLLRLLSGELDLATSEGDDAFFAVSGKPIIGVLSQMTFSDENITMVDEIRSAYKDILDMKVKLELLLDKMHQTGDEEDIKQYTTLLDIFTAQGGFYFEKEYEAAIKRFGFSNADKLRPVSEFSGGQRTKLAFLKLLLSKPDLLLLDEPTNHLDIDAVMWLEEYLRDYKKAVVIVSHDRMFLDRIVNEVYEIEHGKTARYVGNYTDFTVKKREQRQLAAKQYEAQQKEIARISAVAERFRYKATKAAMAQSKLKQIERMELVDAPESYDNRTFKAKLEPDIKSAKDVLFLKDLKIGFDSVLSTVSLTVLRGDRVGIIGGNGLGKSTLLKTIVGKIPSLGGEFSFGPNVTIGYFDQQMAQYSGNETVLENFQNEYPHYTDFEARSALGAFMFSGDDVFKTVNMLSGGERVRLALCKLFEKKPNLLILDEPTNHMDIISKETLEDILLSYTGTLIFVSHDRYFINKLSNKLLSFEKEGAVWYEYGYGDYIEQNAKPKQTVKDAATLAPKPKKTYTTPGKEKAKRERAIQKAEQQISMLEGKIESLNAQLCDEQTISDYKKLDELQKELTATEEQLFEVMGQWDILTSENK